MDLSIIIVSFNTSELLKKCLESIFKFLEGINFEVIVVDNASIDESPKMVFEKFPTVRLFTNRKNVGFGAANNQGAKVARGKYLFFFNSDAYLVDDSLLKLVERLNEDPKIGVIGPLVLSPNGSIQQSVGFFPNLPQVFYWMSFLDDLPKGEKLKPYHVDHNSFYQKEQEVDWVTGAAMMVRRDIFKKIGGFDKRIFMYGEDVELCFRIKNEGFIVKFTPITKVMHLGRGSVGGANINAIVGEYNGLIYFYRKYRKLPARLVLYLLLKLGAILRIFIFGIMLGRRELLISYYKAFLAH